MPLLFQLIQKGYALLDKIRIAPTRVFSPINGRKNTQPVKKLPKRPCFCYNRGNGGVFMEGWRKDARHEPIIVDLEALVPKEANTRCLPPKRNASLVNG